MNTNEFLKENYCINNTTYYNPYKMLENQLSILLKANEELLQEKDILKQKCKDLEEERDTLKNKCCLFEVELEKYKRPLRQDVNVNSNDIIKQLRLRCCTLTDRCSSFKFARDCLKKERIALKVKNNILLGNIKKLQNKAQQPKNSFPKIIKNKSAEDDNNCNCTASYSFIRNVLKEERYSFENDYNELLQKYEESEKDKDELFNMTVKLAFERNTLKDRCSSYKFARDCLKKDYITSIKYRNTLYKMAKTGAMNQLKCHTAKQENINLTKSITTSTNKMLLMEKVVLNLAKVDKDKFMSFFCYPSVIPNNTMCVRIPKVIKILSNGGIIQKDDLLALDKIVIEQAYSIVQIDEKSDTLLGEIKVNSHLYYPGALGKIVKICLDWICSDDNASKLVYDYCEHEDVNK